MNDIMFWIDVAIYSLLFFLSLYLLIRNIKLRKYIQINSVEVLEQFQGYKHTINTLKEELEKAKLADVNGSDGFLKFVSQSRDWAFEYIEDVQKAIESLKISVQNGSEIEEDLNKLFSLLPENKEK